LPISNAGWRNLSRGALGSRHEYCTLSPLWVAGWHTVLMQFALVQSVETMQPLPSAHFLPWPSHVAPPQSMSVSVPFFWPSVHVGAWQVVLHTLLVQSAPLPHVLPVAQLPPQVAPQSTSDSVPFFTVSLHVGVLQMPPVQTPLVQSPDNPDVTQTLPSAHLFP